MTLPQKHFKDTKKLALSANIRTIRDWLLDDGYYPEQYVLPPPFVVKTFNYNKNPYYKVKVKGYWPPNLFETINVSFPKSQLTDRVFGIIEPTLYHDVVWHLINEWKNVIKHLFDKDIKIFSYSFPIPVTKRSNRTLGPLRAGRMIYEFLEMAENDLVAEAHKYKYIVKTDIKNFYPTIYTHSIAWALHGKSKARLDKRKFNLLGNKLDKLFQCSNDGCTNGLPIGSAISDLVAEMILAGIDKNCSINLKGKKIDFLGVRFKDDYRFLCHSKADAETIIKCLQNCMRVFNLTLNEDKTKMNELPEGLYREWISEYSKITLRYEKRIGYKKFENTLLSVLKIDKEHPETGIIDRFLSELYSKNYNLKLDLNGKNVVKIFSLLLLLKERRVKAFPTILGIIEKIFDAKKQQKKLYKWMVKSIKNIFEEKLGEIDENQYDLLWLTYFIMSNNLFTINWPTPINCPLIKSLSTNRQQFFNSSSNIKLYSRVKPVGQNVEILRHLKIF